MKKLTKILLAAGGAALICGASAMTYLKAQTQQSELSDLTLQNLEAMALPPDEMDKWDELEITLDCNQFCTRDPYRACRVPVIINESQHTYTCDSWRK
ncbi:hypothetical protein [uncultured Rikenella sp.]|uniref:hypothetical protein n=1 Tax=uncultured Rikenella sp. TaxID=368003 RepID=UPI0025CCB2C2|nr:hypothetical protein [uncultured Rikenella sp.]